MRFWLISGCHGRLGNSVVLTATPDLAGAFGTTLEARRIADAGEWACIKSYSSTTCGLPYFGSGECTVSTHSRPVAVGPFAIGPFAIGPFAIGMNSSIL